MAEKIHAYTRRYSDDRESSRPKGLIDILLMADLGTFDSGTLRGAINRVFDNRATHPVPDALPAPPVAWTAAYRTLAAEVGLDADDLTVTAGRGHGGKGGITGRARVG